MKKLVKKLSLNKETLRLLKEDGLRSVAAGIKTVDGTACVTNCPVTVCQTNTRLC